MRLILKVMCGYVRIFGADLRQICGMCVPDPHRGSAKNTFFWMFFSTRRHANAKSLQKHVSTFGADRGFSRFLYEFDEKLMFFLFSREGNQDIELEREKQARERARFAEPALGAIE